MLIKYLYREVGPGRETSAIALVSFNSMYLLAIIWNMYLYNNMERYS